MRSIRFPPWVSLALLLAACSESTAPAETGYPPWPSPEYATFYGGGLRLSVFEAPGDHPSDSAADWRWSNVREPRIVLSLKSLREWGGCGARLEADVSQQENLTTVTVGRVFTPVLPCVGWPPPAASYSSFVALSEGENILALRVLDRVFEYRVRVTSSAIDLVRVTPRSLATLMSGVEIFTEVDTFWRFPEHSAAVYCESSTSDCETLFEALAREPGFERHYFARWGHLPYPQLEMPDQETAYFRYREASDFGRLHAFLCRVAPSESGRAALALSWRNEQVISLDCP